MKSRSERKARMMEIAEKEIEKLLDWQEKSERPDLSGIEEEVLRIRKRIGEGMARKVIESHRLNRAQWAPANSLRLVLLALVCDALARVYSALSLFAQLFFLILLTYFGPLSSDRPQPEMLPRVV